MLLPTMPIARNVLWGKGHLNGGAEGTDRVASGKKFLFWSTLNTTVMNITMMFMTSTATFLSCNSATKR